MATKKKKMVYVLFDEDCETILGAYSTPDKAQDAREEREAELGFGSDRTDELFIAWVPIDLPPDPSLDVSG